MDRLIPSLVLELQQLTKPKDKKDQKFLSNLSKISTTLVMIESEAAEARLECLVVETIVKAAFSEDVLSDYNELYYECSVEFIKNAVADGVCTKEDGHKTFEHQDNQKVRLDLLKSFIEKQSALYNMGVQPSQGNSKVKKDQGSHGAHLVNASEKWLCPLCQTPHKDDRGRARKYFFHNTCPVFKAYSA